MELAYRDGLELAIERLDQDGYVQLLEFIYKKCDSTSHQDQVLTVLDIVIRKRACETRARPEDEKKISNLLEDIADKLAGEYETCKEAADLQAVIELLEDSD